MLIRAPNWLGDAVMALPALEAVRRACAGPNAIVAGRAGVHRAALPRADTPAAPDEVLVVDRTRHEAAQIGPCAAQRADAILLLPNSFGSAWAARRAGVRERWGYRADWRGPLLTRGVRRPRRGRLHHVEYYLSLVRRARHRTGAGGVAADRAAAADARAGRTRCCAQAGIAPEGVPLVGFAPGRRLRARPSGGRPIASPASSAALAARGATPRCWSVPPPIATRGVR